jgi:hypothetical protein
MFAKLLKDTKTKKKTKIFIRAPREYNTNLSGADRSCQCPLQIS